MKNIPLIKFCIFLGFFLLEPQIVFAINCKNITNTGKIFAILMCSSKQLQKLDDQVNKEYALCLTKMNKDTLIADQKAWVKIIEKIDNVESLIDKYKNRLAMLELCTHKIKIKHTLRNPKPNEYHNKKNKVHYIWHVIKLKNKTVLEYPQLTQNLEKKFIKNINQEIKEDIKDYLSASLSTNGDSTDTAPIMGISYQNFIFTVIANNYNIFGIDVFDQSEGCLLGCAHPMDGGGTLYKKFWDLQTGKEINIFSFLKIIPGKKRNFGILYLIIISRKMYKA